MTSVIRAVKVFESLSDAECAELVRFMRIRQYEAGATIFERGKPGDSMLVIAEGALSVVMPGPRRGNIEVARVGVAEVVGEMSCIVPTPRCATMLAAVRTTAYEFGRKELATMRLQAPAVAAAVVSAVIRSVALRLRRVDERIERELAGHLAARLPELRQATRTSGRTSSRRSRTRPAPEPTEPDAWTVLLGRLRGSA
jgi:CRP/FNR family cyclic AMP-dependent transcriptional regulator